MGKANDETKIFTPERRKKWFGRYRTHYGKASAYCSGASGVCGIIAPFADSLWAIGFGVAAASSAALAWTLGNADKDKADTLSKTDFDGLVSAIDKSHSGLSDAASVSPDDRLAKNYLGTVLEELRVLLEPEGKDNLVRICLYRKDSGERKEKADGDPRIEEEFSPKVETEVTVAFTRYVFERGGRTDHPRWDFVSTEPPGSIFFEELFLKGRYECSTRQELSEISEDHYYNGKSKEPAYTSFINIALKDDSNETFAMLTCDSIEENFFDERRNRLIKAFIPLIKLALQDGATAVPQPKRRLDQLESSKKIKVLAPIKPQLRTQYKQNGS